MICNKNICILTAYTDFIQWENYGKCDYGDLSSTNHLTYSNLHSYSYIKEIVNSEKYKERHLTWIKIDVLLKYLPMYDYVVWIDADAIFYNMDLKIEQIIEDDNVDLVIPKQEVDRLTGNVWTHTTTGFMIWKNSNWSISTLSDIWNNPLNYIFDFFHEQSRLDISLFDNYITQNDNLLNKLQNDIEHPIRVDNVMILPYSYHRYYTDGEIKYVYHAGAGTPTKMERIKNCLNTKNG